MTADLMDLLDAFRQISLLNLTKLLDSIGGSKDIIIEGNIMKPLEKFIGVTTLKRHGVEQIFKLEKKEVAVKTDSVIYLIRGDLFTTKKVCDQINAAVENRMFHLIVVPQSFYSVKTLVEEEGLMGKVQLHSFSWELLQVDTRILSLEHPQAFKYYFTAKDPTYSFSVAKSLWTLQHILGQPRSKIFLGKNSKSIESLIGTLSEVNGEPDLHNSKVGLLFVVDRDIDYASVLLTPGTYTSLVDDVLAITSGSVDVPQSSRDEKQQSTRLILTSDDDTYCQIKHKHFSDVGLYLKSKIREFYENQAKRHDMTVQEMRDFVNRGLSKAANTGKALSNHLRICEGITKTLGEQFEVIQSCQHDLLKGEYRRECLAIIEDLIAIEFDYRRVLRLICILCLCQGGLTVTEASHLKMQFFHAYGHEHIVTFSNLEKMGLFSTFSPVKLTTKVLQGVSLARKTTFNTLATKLKLFPDIGANYSVKNPQEPGYIFGGIYIPLLVQLLRIILKKEKPVRDVLKQLPIDSNDISLSLGSGEHIDVDPKCIVLFVVGGISYAEVAALSFVEKETGYRIVCAGTNMINGNSLIQSAVS